MNDWKLKIVQTFFRAYFVLFGIQCASEKQKSISCPLKKKQISRFFHGGMFFQRNQKAGSNRVECSQNVDPIQKNPIVSKEFCLQGTSDIQHHIVKTMKWIYKYSCLHRVPSKFVILQLFVVFIHSVNRQLIVSI
jgi:hypothetical protein